MLKNQINGINIYHFEELASTNRHAMAADAAHLDVILADRQSSGRGRLGRSFFSPDGGLYMSVVLEPENILCGLPFCTAAAAVATRDALMSFGIKGLSVKWVNDLLLDGRKVCGILTEAKTELGNISRVVVGIGINLKSIEFPEELRERAGAVGFEGDRLALAAEIAKRLSQYIGLDRCEIARAYEKSLTRLGERAEITDYADGQRRISGVLLGVDENCFLRLRLDDGTVRTLSSGEILSF